MLQNTCMNLSQKVTLTSVEKSTASDCISVLVCIKLCLKKKKKSLAITTHILRNDSVFRTARVIHYVMLKVIQ